MEQARDLVAQRRHKLEEIRSMGYDPYPTRYEFTHTISRIVSEFSAQTAAQLEEEPVLVRICGRMILERLHGKAGFAHLADGSQRLQIYVKLDNVGDKLFRLFKLLDIGDIIGVAGKLFRTKTGELTVNVAQAELLSKALLPLPEKWHGLSDVETRYRQRYLDLMVNPQVREVFIKRNQIIREIRRFLDDLGYLEVETPMMQSVPGGATARPFKTFHNALGIPLYLRVAPELYLKRLVVGGLDRVYEINRNFRNEGISTQHNPEFTMLEFYQAYSNFEDLIKLTEKLLTQIVCTVTGGTEVEFNDEKISFAQFNRYTMKEAIVKFWDRGEPRPAPEDLTDREKLRALFERAHRGFPDLSPTGELIGQLFETIVEDKLVQPTFIYDYPVELSPLSKRKKNDPSLVDRFELYIGKMEVANAYSELNDPEDQSRRFEDQVKARERGNEEAHPMDDDYIRALSYAMPPTAGEGIGIDRLTMLLTNSRSIRDVILFPQMRPERSEMAEGD
ncbi:MAG: lysine--tRNA ligase [Acidobacteria bacterium]|nr:lysine--tRNA ligase [Acidobacteriota bacterium]MBI3654866.1 lysine--tRNA ligase [Acidobacteriota bacterium]